MTTVPLSVVVASFSGVPALARCLGSIVGQDDAAEVLVATDLTVDAVEPLRREFPGVVFLHAPAGTEVFRLRTLGVTRAGGEIVALTEDHCTAAAGWLAELRRAFADGHEIVGGPVDNGLDRGVYDWSLYFCEYLWHAPRLHDGPADILSGVNVAYRRPLLALCRETWRDVFYENQVHDVLRARGYRLHRAAGALVNSHLQMPLRAALRHLYGGGRHFGIYRQAHASRLGRLLWVAAGPLVPVVLLARMTATLAGRQPGRLGTLLRGLPYVLCMTAAWSAGEAAGYLTTSPLRRRILPL